MKLVVLLEREATTVRPVREDDGGDSETGAYLTQLARVVVRLQDPTSTRGLALLGIGSNADAQRFVASQGDGAVAFLDEAELADSSNVGPVTATRARMLGEYLSVLSPALRPTVRAAILRVAATNQLAFARGARLGRLVEATPLVSEFASAATNDLDRAILTDAASQLTVLRNGSTVESILDGLTASLTAICNRAQGDRLTACQQMVAQAKTAFDYIRAAHPAQAHEILLALAAAATEAARRGFITPIEATMIAGTSTHLATRI
jgi:hypothetical protein